MARAQGGLIRRTVLASTVLMIIIGAAFAVLLILIGEQRQATRLSRHSEDVFGTAEQVQRLAVDMQAAQVKFTVTGAGGYITMWQADRSGLPPASARLRQLARTAAQQNETQQIIQTTDSYVQEYSVPTMAAAEHGDGSARSLLTVQEGDRRIDRLRAELNTLTASERELDAAHSAHAEMMADREVTAVTAGAAAAAVVIALIGGYQTRLMVRPIRRAAVMADGLAGGDLSSRVPETGKAEVGQLEHSFNIMAASLERNHQQLEQFGETQTALRRVATLVARGAPPNDILEAVAAELGRLIDTETARIVRYEADGSGTVVAAWGAPDLELPVGTRISLEGRNVSALVRKTDRAVRMDTYKGAPGPLAAHLRTHGMRAAIGAPIHIEGRLWGAVLAATMRVDPPPPHAEARLAEYTDLIGTAIANTQARADLVASRARVMIATDQARRRIERDLHDGVQQRLIALGLDICRAEESVSPEQDELRRQLADVVAGLNDTLDDVREISRGVHPAILTERGLRPALNALVRRAVTPVELELRLDDRLPEPVEVAAYYVATEALANAAKYAAASLVRISALVRGGCLYLSVCDDGRGGADPQRGSGLIGLVDRVEALGGTVRIDSPVGEGTCLRVALPLRNT